jgi:hypothetical protein
MKRKLAVLFGALFLSILSASGQSVVELVHNDDISVYQQIKPGSGTPDLGIKDQSDWIIKNHSDKSYNVTFMAYGDTNPNGISLPYQVGPYQTTNTGQDNAFFGGDKYKFFVCPAPYFAKDRTVPSGSFITSHSEERDVQCISNSNQSGTSSTPGASSTPNQPSAAYSGGPILDKDENGVSIHMDASGDSYVITNSSSSVMKVAFVAVSTAAKGQGLGSQDNKAPQLFTVNPGQELQTNISKKTEGDVFGFWSCAAPNVPAGAIRPDHVPTAHDIAYGQKKCADPSFFLPQGAPTSMRNKLQ